MILLLGNKIKKTKPCVIISPNEINFLKTVIVAPLTSKGFKAPTRISCNFNDAKSYVLLDQIRAVDKKRLIKNFGQINNSTREKISSVLIEMFTLEED